MKLFYPTRKARCHCEILKAKNRIRLTKTTLWANLKIQCSFIFFALLVIYGERGSYPHFSLSNNGDDVNYSKFEEARQETKVIDGGTVIAHLPDNEDAIDLEDEIARQRKLIHDKLHHHNGDLGVTVGSHEVIL